VAPELRILHLEDDPLDTELVCGLLAADGLAAQLDRVDTLAAFRDALQSVCYEVILSDYSVPGVDAMEALALARRLCPELPFIFLSGALGEEQAIETLKQGASDYVLKQRMGRLASAVRRALHEAQAQARHREAEDALRRSEARLRLAQEVARIGTFEWNIQTDENHWAPELEALYGLPPGGFDGTYAAWTALVHPEDLAELESRLRAAMQNGRFEGEWRARWPDGQVRWLAARAEVFMDGAGKPLRMVGVNIDITEQRRIDAMKTELISTVNHELRTPITAIVGALGLIRGGVTGELPAQARSLIEIAHRNSERLVRLINDFLNIEKIESGKVFLSLRPVDLAEVARECLAANTPYAEQHGVRIELEPVPPGLQVQADPDRLAQVFANLLSNAAKFSLRGEAVTISIHPNGAHVRVSVTDRGPGIPPAFRPRVFQKFAQADTSGGKMGTGLGLSIAKAIVARHGGEMGFETEAGQGTTFWFELPAAGLTEAAGLPEI
jgi:PAS domain S-box-containing protein